MEIRTSVLGLIALAALALPAALRADPILFSDLGTSSPTYDASSGWTISGSASGAGASYTEANLFPVAGSGSEAVSEIDLAVSHGLGASTFYASIWSDVGGTPGSQLAGAYWSLSTSQSFGSCCALVSITSISGVTLIGGAEYFLVLGPLSTTDNSLNVLNLNNQGVTGEEQYSNNGGITWVNGGSTTLGAFDVLGGPLVATPEPSSLLLLGAGLLCVVGAMRWIAFAGNNCAALSDSGKCAR